MKLIKFVILSILTISALSLSLTKNKKSLKQNSKPLTNKIINGNNENHYDSDVNSLIFITNF